MAVIRKGRVLAVLRDADAGIPYPGMWDLPGGGREGAESAVDCAVRECLEETGLRVCRDQVVWQKEHVGQGRRQWFLVARVERAAGLRLGDEGQALRWFGVEEFSEMGGAIAHLRARLREYLEAE